MQPTLEQQLAQVTKQAVAMLTTVNSLCDALLGQEKVIKELQEELAILKPPKE